MSNQTRPVVSCYFQLISKQLYGGFPAWPIKNHVSLRGGDIKLDKFMVAISS